MRQTAAARNIAVKIVADKRSTIPGHSYMPVLIRKALVESGEIKSFADLKGRKVAQAGQGGSPGSTLNEALKQAGLSYGDVRHIYNLGYPQHLGRHNRNIRGAKVTVKTYELV
jgi:NitT/TauT family transport system substrate-binding protein